MKNNKIKRIIIGVVVLILIIYFAPFKYYNGYQCVLSNNAEMGWCRGKFVSMFNKSKDVAQERKLLASSDKLEPIYEIPDKIGDFKKSEFSRSLPLQCYSLTDFANPKNVCIVGSELEYINSSTFEMVKVNIYRVLAGKENFIALIKSNFAKIEFEDYEVGRVDVSDFSWFPVKDVDFIKVTESVGVKDFAGNYNYIMPTNTKGTSLVTSYFLEKYSPNRSDK
jgi:hypothetical protein